MSRVQNAATASVYSEADCRRDLQHLIDRFPSTAASQESQTE